MKNHIHCLFLFLSLITHQSYADYKDPTTICAEALGLGKELRNFYASKDTFLRYPSPDNNNAVAVFYNHLLDRAEVPYKALHIAASQGDTSRIRHLVSMGSPVDIRGREGMTPLNVAGAFGHIEAIDVLLELGADINAPDAVGNSPLISAIVNDQGDAVEHLLNKDANIDQLNIVDETPIMFAVRHDRQEIFRILASRRANLMSTNMQGWTFLHNGCHLS